MAGYGKKGTNKSYHHKAHWNGDGKWKMISLYLIGSQVKFLQLLKNVMCTCSLSTVCKNCKRSKNNVKCLVFCLCQGKCQNNSNWNVSNKILQWHIEFKNIVFFEILPLTKCFRFLFNVKICMKVYPAVSEYYLPNSVIKCRTL